MRNFQSSKTVSADKKGVLLAPSSTGVYLFKKNQEILYIGKAVSLKARLLSHLENAKLDPKEDLIVKNSDKIECFLTDSEFKALLLESSLIQKYQPKYNLRWKDNKSYLYIKISIKEEFPKLYTVRRENDGRSLYFGPFPSEKDAEEILRRTRKIFPFCRQKKVSKRPCFYSKIGLCKPCPSEIANTVDKKIKTKLKRDYRFNIKQLIRILQGDVELALKKSYKMLKQLTKNQLYEEALKLRDKIQRFERLIYQTKFSSDISIHFNRSSEALNELLDALKVYFSRLQTLQRIECYDVSNLFQKEATASMVVFSDGMPDKSEYKRFRIKSRKIKSDFAMLDEIFLRRFRQNWHKPNLIIVDGGTPQVLLVKKILSNLGESIPLIGIAKHPDRIVISAPDKLITARPSLNNLGFNLVRALRDEAHRFARKYHLLLRKKRMMI